MTDRPIPAVGRMPFPGSRTMAEVWHKAYWKVEEPTVAPASGYRFPCYTEYGRER